MSAVSLPLAQQVGIRAYLPAAVVAHRKHAAACEQMRAHEVEAGPAAAEIQLDQERALR